MFAAHVQLSNDCCSDNLPHHHPKRSSAWQLGLAQSCIKPMRMLPGCVEISNSTGLAFCSQLSGYQHHLHEQRFRH